MKYIIFVVAVVISCSLYFALRGGDTLAPPTPVAAGIITDIGSVFGDPEQQCSAFDVGPCYYIQIDHNQSYVIPVSAGKVRVGDYCEIWVADNYAIVLR